MIGTFATSAKAQLVDEGLGPNAAFYGERAKPKNEPVLPVPLAVSLAFDATTWAAVQVSSAPARDLTALFRRGYYKLELIETVLIAQAAGVKLQQVVLEHDKGATLRAIAAGRKLDFDALYDQSLAVDARVVDRLLPAVMTISSAKPGGPPKTPP